MVQVTFKHVCRATEHRDELQWTGGCALVIITSLQRGTFLQSQPDLSVFLLQRHKMQIRVHKKD